MEKKDLLKKQELAEELGMKFDEVAGFFSEETLSTMQMVKFQGRKDVDVKAGCDAKTGSCNNITCPSTDSLICINIDIDIDIACPSDGGTTQPPYGVNFDGCTSMWGGACPTSEPPTPPTVQQDAICWQTPPLPFIIK